MKKQLFLSAGLLSLVLAAGCGKDNPVEPASPESSGPSAADGGGGGSASGAQAPHVKTEMPTAKASPQKTSMAEVAKHLDFGGSAFSYKSNEGMGSALAGLFSIIETMMQAEGDPQAMAALKVARNVYEQSGFKAISGTGSSSFVMENGITRNARMAHYWPGKDKGFMWELIGGPEHELGGLKLMPANTTLAMHGDLDLTAGWKWIKAFMAEQDPAMAREFNTMLTQMANENIPVDELLESLAGEVGMSVVLHPTKTVKVPVGRRWEIDEQGNERFVPETITLPEPGFVLAVKVKDTLLLEMLGGMLQAQGAEATDVNGVKMLTLALPPGEAPFPLSPTMMKAGDYLVFTSTQDLAKEVLDIQAGKSKGLSGTADFLKITAGMDLKGNHLFYLSPLLKSMGLKLVEEALAKEQEFKDLNKRGAMMKFINLFAGYLSHQVILVKRMPNGLLVDNRAAGGGLMAGGGGTGTVATVGILASMLLPALAKAKAKANAIKSINNASQLGRGLHGYASENDGRLPPANRWCDAILREVGSERVFMSPQDPWAGTVEEGKPNPSSYAMNAAVAGKNLNELAQDTVLVFECQVDWNGTGGLEDIRRARAQMGSYRSLQVIAVTLADGSSRQVPFGQLDGLNWTGQRRR